MLCMFDDEYVDAYVCRYLTLCKYALRPFRCTDLPWAVDAAGNEPGHPKSVLTINPEMECGSSEHRVYQVIGNLFGRWDGWGHAGKRRTDSQSAGKPVGRSACRSVGRSVGRSGIGHV